MKTISNKNVIYKFEEKMEAVDTISSGDTVVFETNDCWTQQVTSEDQVITEIDYDILNPATGPIYVEGAEPGDILKIYIESIDVKQRGSALCVPNEGVLGDQVKESRVKIIDILDGYALYNNVKIPISPMIGVIGVAPAKDDGQWTTDTPWKHGGNMDTKDIKQGNTLYLPVNQKGALLALGDCHAVMGDGELCFTGLEVPAKVTLKVDVIKNKSINWPMIEDEKYTMIIASGKDLDEAIYTGTDEAVKFLMKGLEFDWEDAYVLASLIVDIKISQVVDPTMTIRAAIPKEILTTEKLIGSI
ncbi:MAG: acetamidase/formamidase family protein [Tissierellia bacterium]|nr:acetamidase/formamidase family protein [Tissierellia bacterium]